MDANTTPSNTTPRGFWTDGGTYVVHAFQTTGHVELTERGWDVGINHDTLFATFPADQKEQAIALADELAFRFGNALFQQWEDGDGDGDWDADWDVEGEWEDDEWED
jgi:hypothetical protein